MSRVFDTFDAYVPFYTTVNLKLNVIKIEMFAHAGQVITVNLEKID